MRGGLAMRRKKLKGTFTLVETVATTRTTTHDRRSTDLLINSRVAAVVVDDPLEHGAKLTVLRSLRDDPLAGLHAAGQIDQCSYIAGRHWQRAFEIAQGTGMRAIDPTREHVDGGGIPQATVTDAQIKAFADLTKASKALGMEGESIVMDVLGRGLTLAIAAGKRGLITEAERKYIGRRFRECLDTLSGTFGYSCPQATTKCS